jgi:hypothetical protein
MSVRQHSIENQIAVTAADWAMEKILMLGATGREAIAEWHRVNREVLDIAQRPHVRDLPR